MQPQYHRHPQDVTCFVSPTMNPDSVAAEHTCVITLWKSPKQARRRLIRITRNCCMYQIHRFSACLAISQRPHPFCRMSPRLLGKQEEMPIIAGKGRERGPPPSQSWEPNAN